jgi:hypothetical protein
MGISFKEIRMKMFVLAALAAGKFLLPQPASAGQPGLASNTDVSAQVTVRENRRGGVSVRVGDGHRRWESRRRRAGCERITTKRRIGNRVVTRTVTRCR